MIVSGLHGNNEVLSTGLQPELLVNSPHRIDIKIDTYVVIIDNQYPEGF